MKIANPIKAAHIQPAAYLKFILKISPRDNYFGTLDVKTRIHLPKDAAVVYSLSRDKLLDAVMAVQTLCGSTGADPELIKF